MPRGGMAATQIATTATMGASAGRNANSAADSTCFAILIRCLYSSLFAFLFQQNLGTPRRHEYSHAYSVFYSSQISNCSVHSFAERPQNICTLSRHLPDSCRNLSHNSRNFQTYSYNTSSIHNVAKIPFFAVSLSVSRGERFEDSTVFFGKNSRETTRI